MEAQGYVKMQVKGGLGIIEFFHPAHNALPGKLLSQLAQAIKEASVSSDIRVVLLQSGGNRTFCAGASFDELQAVRTPEEGKAFFMGFARVIQACRQCLCLQPQQWQSAEWAAQHGLYQDVFPSTDALDQAIDQLANHLLQYNPEALFHIKEMLWYGTDHWNTLLEKRAEISGALILSDFSRHAIQRIKNKTK